MLKKNTDAFKNFFFFFDDIKKYILLSDCYFQFCNNNENGVPRNIARKLRYQSLIILSGTRACIFQKNFTHYNTHTRKFIDKYRRRKQLSCGLVSVRQR